MIEIDETHDPASQSWVPSANVESSDFPVQNLAFGVFEDPEDGPRVGVAIGDQILDVSSLSASLFQGIAKQAAAHCAETTLNGLMACSSDHWRALRQTVSRLLRSDTDEGRSLAEKGATHLVAMSDATMLMPAEIGDFTDFYASIFHARNVGSLFRPENPLLPNYKYVPVAYHGRASSVMVSGVDFARPLGQRRPPGADSPSFEPCQQLDFEAEIGIFVGPGNAVGEPIPLAQAPAHIFGLCLLHDWSARDIQAWEYQPLGPFLAKNFASHVSPWVVTTQALAPYRVPAYARPDGDPAPLGYLFDERDQESGGLDIRIDISLLSESMRQSGAPAHRLAQTKFADLYWTIAQMVAHHTASGCNLRPGDLLGSGTVSSSGEREFGSMIEQTERGASPLTLDSGETRSFLEDGDEVILEAYCVREGYRRLGFGQCRAKILPPGPPKH